MSPVSEPKNIIGIGRWRNVNATLSAVEKMARLPIAIQSLVEKEVGDREVLDALKLDASVDFAAALDPAAREPDVLFAFSIPLKSLDQAKGIAERDGKTSMIRPGVYRLGRTRQTSDVSCAIALSLGDAPARLVCGKRDRDLDALLPFMTRGLPSANFGPSDVHLEARFAPLQEKAKPLIEQSGTRLPAMAALMVSRELGVSDPALLDLVGAVATEGVRFGEDLEGVTLDIALDPASTTGDVKGTLRFLGAKSWLVQVLTSRADRQGPAPDLFWKAPKDSDTAFFGRGSEPKLWEGIPKAIGALVSALGKDKLPDADRTAIADLLAHAPLVDAVTVSARGHVDAPEAKKGTPTPADAIRAAREKVGSVLGWSLVGFDAKPDAVTAWLKELVRVYNRPSLQAFFKKTMRSDARMLPVIRTVAAPPGLPAGTFAIEGGVNLESRDVWDAMPRRDDGFVPHPAGAAAKGFIGVTMIVAPDGPARTWIGFGGDAAILRDKLKASLSAASKDGSLASRPGLESLRSGALQSGGFVSIAGSTHSILDLARGRASRSDTRVLAAISAAMPNKGQTPVLVTSTAKGGATPSVAVEVQIPKGTVDDVAAAILAGFAQRNAARSDDVPMPMPMPPPPPPPPRKKKLGRLART